MPRKPKFRPEITRIKLNPEQAVLSCDCFSNTWVEAAEKIDMGYTPCGNNQRALVYDACDYNSYSGSS